MTGMNGIGFNGWVGIETAELTGNGLKWDGLMAVFGMVGLGTSN